MTGKQRRNSRIQLFIAMFFSGAAFVISYLINFFLAPYITEHIGTEAYGFISLARNFASYAVIVTTALNSYAARYISVEYHRGNLRKSNEYFSSVFYANVFLTGIMLLISAVGILFLERLINIPEALIWEVKALFGFVFVNFTFTALSTAFTAGAYIRNRLDLVGIIKGASYIAEAATIIVCFTLIGAKLWFVGASLAVAALVILASNWYLTRTMTPELKIQRESYSGTAVKTLVGNGIWNSINSLGNVLNSGLDLIITNLLLSPIAMGQLSYAKTIGTMFSTLYQLVSQPFQPVFLKLYSEHKMPELIKEMKFSMKVSGFFSSVAFAGFAVLGRVYFQLWIPDQDIELINALTMMTIVSCLGEGVICPLFYVYTLTVKFKIPCLVTIFGGILNIVGKYLLLHYTDLGIYAITLTTAVIISLINLVFNPLYMSRCLNVSCGTLFPAIMRHLISCGVLTVCFYLISKVFMPYSWLTLILAATVDGAAGLILHILIVFDKSERDQLLRIILKK